MSKSRKKVGTLLAAGAAALMISSVTGCKVDINQTSGGGSDSGSSSSGGGGTGGSASGGTGSGGGSSSTKSGGGTGGSGGSGGTSTGSKVAPAGAPAISLSRTSLLLVCPGDACTQQITIRSTGTAPLQLYSFVILDDADFHFDSICVNKQLRPGDSCTFSVSYQGAPSDNVITGRLVIHQNLPGEPTYIALTKHPIPA